MAADVPRVSASEIAEYAYCPRARYYHQHPPFPGAADDPRAAAGRAFHTTVLRAEVDRDDRAGAFVALIVAGAVLFGIAALWLWSMR